MKKLKRLIKISWFKKKKETSTSADWNLAGCPETYAELPVRALEMKTRLRLAEYLDKKGKRLKVEIDNTSTDIMNDFTGLAKLSGQKEGHDTVVFKNIVKSPTMTLFDQLIDHGVRLGKLWEYLLILQRHDVIKDCRPIILNDCQTFSDQTKTILNQLKNPAWANKKSAENDDVTVYCTELTSKLVCTLPIKREAENDNGRGMLDCIERLRLSSPFSWPRISVYEMDLKNAPTVGIEPMTSRSLGGHHIHYITATLK
ncbi:hypothetical protein DPMN_056300 [Dreissena polymorpha]|uniref:Uncharacterized protein n=1 Tax=Dreissena polymorpha TaxID=45954 RepID=A0A9D4HRD8_DREPO|nr:hypothetical protein DPMN_056300 [Dreissena polymorpha]